MNASAAVPGALALTRAERVRLALLAGLGRATVRALGASLRLVEVRREVMERVWTAGGPVIYAVWHGRMLMLPYFYAHTRKAYVLASRSRDGELLSRFVQGFGLRVVRGSSSRGSATALRALTRLLREERAEVVVVPDGPRGPRYAAHVGPVLLAKLGEAPVVPLGFGASRRTVLGSWDEFLIPHPFARATVVFGDPIMVPPDADREALEGYRRTLEATLTRLTLEADRVAGAPGVPAL